MEDNISTYIEGVEVHGVITHRSGGDITVEITKPFKNMCKGLHIPYFSRPYRSFQGEYGDLTAIGLLKEMFDIGFFISLEIDKLSQKLSHARDSINRITNKFDDEDFKKRRRELKQLLKKNIIDNKAYQKEFIIIRKKLDEFNRNVEQIMEVFFEDNFQMIIPYSMRDQILDIIDGKNEMAEIK